MTTPSKIGIVAHTLGRIIDPQGHARDDRARANQRALHNECPTCGASSHYPCHTLTTFRPTTPHAARY